METLNNFLNEQMKNPEFAREYEAQKILITTLEQYEALPEDVRAEVFDGVLYNMSSPSQEHQTVLLQKCRSTGVLDC